MDLINMEFGEVSEEWWITMIRQIVKIRSHYVYNIDSDRGIEIDYNNLAKDKSLERLLTNIGNTLENNMSEKDKDIPLYEEDYYILNDKKSHGDRNFCKLEIDCISPEMVKFKALTYYFYLGSINSNKGNGQEMLVYWIYIFEKSDRANIHYSTVTKSYFMKEDNYIDLDGPRETCRIKTSEKDSIYNDKYILDTSVLNITDPIIRKGFKDFLKVEELVSGSNSTSLIYDCINKVFRCIEEDYDYEKIEKNISLLEKRIKNIEEG